MKPLVVVATLTVRRSEEANFRAYEARAAEIVAAVGGNFERMIRLEGNSMTEFQEVHILTFPDREGFSRYRSHPDLLDMAEIRAKAVLKTEVLTGHDV
jgi:uncharacterized protein (DUF1330 family)